MRRWFSLTFFSLLATLFGCNNDGEITSRRGAPTITGMTPTSVVRGQTNVDGRILGSGYAGIVAVDLGAGIDVKSTQVLSPNEISLKFDIQDSAAPGVRSIRVATVAGVATNDTLLTVSDNRPPVAVFSVTPSKGSKETVFAYDASGSNDPGGSITAFEWNFGDGASGTGQTISHQYASAGTFKTVLTVTDNQQGKATAQEDIEVDNTRPPIPRFSVSPQRGDADTNFRFDASNSNDDGRIVNYAWAFGDERHDQGKVVRHVYGLTGTFEVRLTVTDNDGLQAFIFKDVEISGKPPIANFIVTPSGGPPGTIFQFDGSLSSDPDGEVVQFAWNLGDGTLLSGMQVSHSYATQGTFPVELNVTDNSGLQGVSRRDLQINNSPPPPPPPPAGGVQCTSPAKRGPGFYGDIIGYDHPSHTAVVQLYDTSLTCAKVYYRCGDIRLGGDPNPPEYWLGQICKMWDLGGGKYRISLAGGKRTPAVGDKNVYLWWQDCSMDLCP